MRVASGRGGNMSGGGGTSVGFMRGIFLTSTHDTEEKNRQGGNDDPTEAYFIHCNSVIALGGISGRDAIEMVSEFTGVQLNRWRELERRAVVSPIRIIPSSVLFNAIL